MGKLSNEAEGQKKVIMHFSHDHALELTKLSKTNQAICSGCGIHILPDGDYFACATCNFFLHKECSELPRNIYHPSDKNHNLILILSPSFHCKACGTPGSGFSYNCNICLGDIHSLCAMKPFSATHKSHPHPLRLEFKSPYEGEEGFQCDICGQPGYNQWLYCCQQCGYDVHLHCSKSQVGAEVHIIQEKPASEASSRALSLPISTQKAAINITSVTQSGKSCETFLGFQQVNVSGTIQQALASQNMAITTTQAPFDNPASPPLPMVPTQYRPNVACVYQSSKSSIGFPANCHGLDRPNGSGSSTNLAICVNPNIMMMSTTRGPMNNSNPPSGATQYQPNIAYAQQETKFPSQRQMYSSNGFVYFGSAQGRNNLPIHVGPNAVLVSPNAMTETTNQVPLHTTTPPVVAAQYSPNTVGQGGNFSNGFQASAYPFSPVTASSTIQAIPMSPNGTTMFTTNNSTNPAVGVPQNRPSTAFANQGTTFPNGSQAYGNNGLMYLNGTQGINNQPIYLRPNGGGASMAPMVPQNQGLGYGNPVYYGANQGMMSGVTGMWGGGGGRGDEGSMGLDGSEILNSYVGDYF
ncbi:uncharacterized protein LOC130137584 [Syzygium oleosum]|uniref:uncharacterized protein LOC130137584 n=1 Tax=Syzygium oleosum TaxID=219896 RepID=UPI0024B97ED2|nr:uncharacterized protein LOC130137584 [Syzygium oleosum]